LSSLPVDFCVIDAVILCNQWRGSHGWLSVAHTKHSFALEVKMQNTS